MYFEICGITKKIIEPDKKIFELFKIYESEREITKSHKTIVSDNTAFKNFFPLNIPIKAVLIENAIKDYLKDTKISNESKNLYMRTIQTFLNWLFDNKYLPEKLNLKKKYFFKTVNQENQIFTKEEIHNLITYFSTNDVEFAYLIKFLALTGLRISEALNLTWKNIKSDRIELLNKTIKTSEYVPVTKNIDEILSSLKKINSIKVFRWKASSYSRLNRRLSKALETLNIKKEGRSFHEFRKSYLYYLQQSGVQVNMAQVLMRHKNINVTIKHYQKNDNLELLSAMSKLNNIYD